MKKKKYNFQYINLKQIYSDNEYELNFNKICLLFALNLFTKKLENFNFYVSFSYTVNISFTLSMHHNQPFIWTKVCNIYSTVLCE